MYRILVQLDDGEFQIVASRDELDEAIQFVEEFHAHWPRKYVVRDSEGSDIDLTIHGTIRTSRSAASLVS